MKLNSILFSVLPAVLALATPDDSKTQIETRQSLYAVTDELLFSLALPDFIRRRNARDPYYLDWFSDDCSWSPDNPYGYPFKPACNRLDFGYRNYKKQLRFTDSNKLRIDNNFRSDLYYQCDISGSGSLCRGLADVYYRAVRRYRGRRSAATVEARNDEDETLAHEYQRAVADYEGALHEARKKGEVPRLP